MSVVAYCIACAAVAHAASVSVPSTTTTFATESPRSRLDRNAALHRIIALRGGVREVEDMDDWETVQEEAADKLLVVDFTAVWCGPCQGIAPAYAALADEYADSALLVKVDVDQLGELAQELGVTSMPTFLFFKGGEMIDSMRGADEAGLRALVAEHAAPAIAA